MFTLSLENLELEVVLWHLFSSLSTSLDILLKVLEWRHKKTARPRSQAADI